MVLSNRFPQRRRIHTNNLHRELAPISEAAWAQIEKQRHAPLSALLPAAASRMFTVLRAQRWLQWARPSACYRGARRRRYGATARSKVRRRAARAF